jgi:hypothetical protein
LDNIVYNNKVSFCVVGNTDKKGAYQIEECFKEFVIAKVCFSSNGKISSHFGRLEIDGIKVEIMGDIQKYVNGIWEERVDLEKYKRYITLDGMKLPVLDLEYEYNAYMKLGRIEKALLFKKYINQMKNGDGTIFSFDDLN